MEQSILKSTKKILGVGPDDDSFDLDIITHINSAFSTLHDLGVGPQAGFIIEDDSTMWEEFLPNDADNRVQLSKVRTYVFLKTRILFDPPTLSYHLDSLNKQIQEHEWRINVKREESEWVDPDPLEYPVIDGGDPVSPYFTNG